MVKRLKTYQEILAFVGSKTPEEVSKETNGFWNSNRDISLRNFNGKHLYLFKIDHWFEGELIIRKFVENNNWNIIVDETQINVADYESLIIGEPEAIILAQEENASYGPGSEGMNNEDYEWLKKELLGKTYREAASVLWPDEVEKSLFNIISDIEHEKKYNSYEVYLNK